MFLAVCVEQFEIPKNIPDWWKNMYDLYIIVKCNLKTIGRTTTKENTAKPVWKEKFLVECTSRYMFDFIIKDANRVLPDKLVSRFRYKYDPEGDLLQHIRQKGIVVHIEKFEPLRTSLQTQRNLTHSLTCKLDREREQNREVLYSMRIKHEKKIQILAAENSVNMQKQLSALQKHHEKELQSIQKQHETAENNLKEQLNLQSKLSDEELANARAEFKKKLDATEQSHQQEMRKLNAKHQHTLGVYKLLEKKERRRVQSQLQLAISNLTRRSRQHSF